MEDPYLGEIRMLVCNHAPTDFIPCDGRTLRLIQHTALYSLLGDRFGGDGRNSFAIPNIAPLSDVGPYFYIAYRGQFPMRECWDSGGF